MRGSKSESDTMRAVVFHGQEDVRVERVPVPACGEEELRVRIEACAICGSDLKTYHSGNPRMKPPMTIGHEFTGVIDTVGASVRGFSPGERIVMATSISCGECVYCRRGWSNLCLNMTPVGYSYPGGMAEYMIVPPLGVRNGHVIKVPPGLEPRHACLAEPVSCAVNAVEIVGIGSGDTVVVIGAGPLGIMNLYVAREFGAAKTILAQREGRRLEMARQFDCDRLVNTSAEDLEAVVREETGGLGADVVIVAAPAAEVQAQAVNLVRKRGRVSLFASLPVGRSILEIDSRKIHYGELAVHGASDSAPRHVVRALEILRGPGFPRAALASHVLRFEDFHRAVEIMTRREGMRVVLTP
ncbi:MAG: alcohol dehydrogenase catalytic domain-containing protein [Spirochaetales bacterium]|nr:alcohol dehydrogenase catalytic domain-containing protein [Spirochaetales bacterium]